MKTKTELINSWIDKAEKDLLTAEHEMTFADRVTESICFHCQQAVEKYLKAYLIHFNISYPKTHEIGELITRCETKDHKIKKFKEEADILTDYAVEIRYPDDWYEPTSEETEQAIKIAKRAMFPIFRSEQVALSQMKIGVGGTGFFINSKGYFISVAHVFDNTNDATKFLYIGRLPDQVQNPFLEIKEITRDDEFDIFVGKIEIKSPNYFKLFSIFPILYFHRSYRSEVSIVSLLYPHK